MAPTKKPKLSRPTHYFQEWRNHRKLTQDKAMELLGWSQSKISRLERGETPFDQDDLTMASKVYDCSPVDLLTTDPRSESNISTLIQRLQDAAPNDREDTIKLAIQLLDTRERIRKELSLSES